MTKFDKTQFNFDGMYLTYGTDYKFVARFKRGGLGSFKTFLIKNFTVEEYFSLADSGMAPLTILESKGYVSPNAAKVLKYYGFPVSQEGKQQYLAYETARLQFAATA